MPQDTPSAGQYASALRTYAPNPFTAGGGGGRSYAQNPFAASQPQPTGQLAAHLLTGPQMDADLLQAYRDVRADPRASQYEQSMPDIDKLWRMSPNAPIFKSGYEHNPYVLKRQQEIIAARTPKKIEELAPDPWAIESMAPAAS